MFKLFYFCYGSATLSYYLLTGIVGTKWFGRVFGEYVQKTVNKKAEKKAKKKKETDLFYSGEFESSSVNEMLVTEAEEQYMMIPGNIIHIKFDAKGACYGELVPAPNIKPRGSGKELREDPVSIAAKKALHAPMYPNTVTEFSSISLASNLLSSRLHAYFYAVNQAAEIELGQSNTHKTGQISFSVPSFQHHEGFRLDAFDDMVHDGLVAARKAATRKIKIAFQNMKDDNCL
jgi:hypothetical protein